MANPARSGELIGQKLGKYELLALIAVGGTAEIYLARISGASGFEKYLVVKCLLDHLADDQEFVRMFLDEARVGAQLDHSNIVQTLELGEQDGRYYLVIEYLAGMSVAQMARKTQERKVNGGLIDTNLVLGMTSQTCNGLHYAHRKTVQGKPLNLIHRDISPQNLVVSYEGILKIVDFGIAKSDIREAQTRTGTIKGKFAYMSPEQCLAKKIDSRTDIFALGTLTHELLTGRRLFKRSTTYDTYQAIVNGVVPKPSEVNPKLDANVDTVIMKALAYDPEERYQNAQEFGEAILGLLHKRDGSGGAGDISQFFEDHFHEDLTAHADQMREFITGKKPATKDATWDQEFGNEGSAPAKHPNKPAAKPVKRDVPRVAPPQKAKNPKLSSIPSIKPPARRPAPVHLDDDFGDDDEDDEGPTRIEFDPGAHMAEENDESEDSDDGWDDDGPTTIGGLDGSSPGQAHVAAAPPVASTRAPNRPPPGAGRAPQVAGGLPPVPRTDPSLAAGQKPASPDFAAPPATINVSQMPAQMQQPPRAQPQHPQHSQHPPGQPHQPPANQPGQVANALSAYQGQPHGGQAPGMPAAGSVPVQLGGQAPVYPSYSGGALPIAAQGSGAVINSGQPNPYRSGEMRRSGHSAQMPGAMPGYPATSLAGQSEASPTWMHAAAFALCAGVGVGIAALLKMLF